MYTIVRTKTHQRSERAAATLGVSAVSLGVLGVYQAKSAGIKQGKHIVHDAALRSTDTAVSELLLSARRQAMHEFCGLGE